METNIGERMKRREEQYDRERKIFCPYCLKGSKAVHKSFLRSDGTWNVKEK